MIDNDEKKTIEADDSKDNKWQSSKSRTVLPVQMIPKVQPPKKQNQLSSDFVVVSPS